MKKILGLDLGSASIGWALIEEATEIEGDQPKINIIGMGSRIIPYEGTEGKDFEKGTGESRNSKRTMARTARKGYDRYQLRRKYLIRLLEQNDMLPCDALVKLPKLKLWELRDKAVKEKITLEEFGRLLLWLNQKRGYKSSRSEANQDKKDTDYVAEVKSRHQTIRELGLTIGQYFYIKLVEDEFYRVKENIFPREAYIEEYDAICSQQKKYYPEKLTDNLLLKIKNEIIYYQRPLKSQKGLVSVCEFEGFWTKNKKGQDVYAGPKVAPKSSPLFQLSKLWENINNISISDLNGNSFEIGLEQKLKLFDYLDNNEKLTPSDLFRILNLKKEKFVLNKQLLKGIPGNITKNAIRKSLGDNPSFEKYLQLSLNIKEYCFCDDQTGEIVGSDSYQYVDPAVEKEPLYQIWHTIYSEPDPASCSTLIQRKFKIDKEIAENLAKIDFCKFGFGNKSSKAIRKILPYLMKGYKYSDAMSFAGYDHSFSITKDQNEQRILSDFIKPIPKNSLRQPIVEKILNQMINVVNTITEKYGKPDEIRIELARELKQSKEERNDTDKEMNKRKRENEVIAKSIAEYGLRATRKNIIKWRLFQEIDNQDKKLNARCIYCGQPISLMDALKGDSVDIEHIIPKAKLFDDSQSNKTLAHRKCNRNKGDFTSYDFMKTKSPEEFEDYIDRVNTLYTNKIIGKAKRDKLLMSEDKIPQNFIDRQLRESQYIAKKSREILLSLCRNVWSTSGTITAELRHLWGWDDITQQLQIPKYQEAGLVDTEEWESEFGTRKHSKEVIKGWTKRDDHRHHAVDALTIACTKQGYIQRFNTLSNKITKEYILNELAKKAVVFNEKLNTLQKYIVTERPIAPVEVKKSVSKILVSFKAGKKVAVKGVRKAGKRGHRKIVQDNIIVPRGALHQEFVYGSNKKTELKQPKYYFEFPDLIVSPKIKALVLERIRRFDGDFKKALASLKKEPIYIDGNPQKPIGDAYCFQNEYVIKYKVDITFDKADKIIDQKIKKIIKNRLAKFNDNPKEAFKDVQNHEKKSIKWYEDEGLKHPIHSVRCYTGLSAVVPVKKNSEGKDIGFVKPGNNHHIAIYVDSEEKLNEHLCTFWHAVERKKYKLPVVIDDTNTVWDKIQTFQDGVLPEHFLELLPLPNQKLRLSMQQNEMFVLGMNMDDFRTALSAGDYSAISDKLYRVQKLGNRDYTFRHHLETQIVDTKESILSKRMHRVRSIPALMDLNPIKVKLNCLGHIVSVIYG